MSNIYVLSLARPDLKRIVDLGRTQTDPDPTPEQNNLILIRFEKIKPIYFFLCYFFFAKNGSKSLINEITLIFIVNVEHFDK